MGNQWPDTRYNIRTWEEVRPWRRKLGCPLFPVLSMGPSELFRRVSSRQRSIIYIPSLFFMLFTFTVSLLPFPPLTPRLFNYVFKELLRRVGSRQRSLTYTLIDFYHNYTHLAPFNGSYTLFFSMTFKRRHFHVYFQDLFPLDNFSSQNSPLSGYH